MKITLSKISALSLLFLFNHPNPVQAAGHATDRAVKSFILNSSRQKEAAPITGTVVDEKGIPMPGVTVKNDATGKALQTDVNGKFTIEAGPDDNITISFLGYQTVTQKAGTQTTLSIKMAPSQTDLKEVKVVGIGYGTQAVREVTSAVAHVGPDDFRQSGARSPLDLIQGKVAGLNLTRTGGSNPNSGISVQLRGAVTVSGSSSPLFVIDGIPGGNPDLLKQDDIESIDILKDGSGAAIYGTQANAGVIIITTKKGKKGPTQIDYSAYYRKEYLQRRLPFLTADEYRSRIASGDLKQDDFGSSTDFVDKLVNHNNFSQNQNLAFSGGTDNSSYRVSLNYSDLQGIAKQNSRKEYALRLNLNNKAFDDHLRMQVNLATNFNNANLLGGGGWESEQTKNPTLSNYNADGSYRFDLTSTNEYARLYQETNKRKQQTTSADVKADFDIIKGLTGTIFGSVVRDSRNDGAYRMKASEFSLENTNAPGGGYAYKGDFLQQDFAFEPTLQYKTTIAKDHNLTALLGYSYRYQVMESTGVSNTGFLNDLLHEDNLNQGGVLSPATTTVASDKNDNTLVALISRVNYSYKGKYLAQASVRREGSSRFGDNHKFGYFPAVSAGWIISEEDFMKQYSFINNLKIRVGYGVTGNSGFANYTSLVTLTGGGKYLFPDGTYQQTYGPNKTANPDLRWETKRETNIGIEFAVLNNKMTGTIDLFDRTTKDLLDTYTLPQPPYVSSSIATNVGTITSKGIEIALGYNAIKRENFNWQIDGTFSTLKNKLVSYSNDLFKVQYKTFAGIGGAGDLGNAITTYEGGDLGEFWGKRFAGFTPEGKWLFYNRNGQAVPNDQINNSKDRNVTDLARIGNAIPKYYASLTNNFNYKNWGLRFFLRGKFDYDILNTNALSYANKTWSGNVLRSTFDKYSQINDTYMYSDYYLESGSFVKLDELTLSYTFKPKIKVVRNIRLYLTGQNLATITGYTGTDPDFIQDTGLAPGVDSRSAYPSTRSFIFGLNVGF